ncbi:MAG: DeoR/GlpR family DNA-binding transcription regulator [Pseudomonadota bacterium]
MREAERLREIQALVQANGYARADELCRLTGASAATLRRDLAKLDGAGRIRRVHGGAQALLPKSSIRPDRLATGSFSAGRLRNVAQKRAIARAAAALCRPHESIIINAGTTTFQMVDFLRDADLQIVTNSFPMAQALVAQTQNRVLMPGGEIRREQGIVLSPFDDDGLHRMAAKRMFMGAHSVGPLGVIEGDPLIARAETKLLARAEELVVMVDSSKFEPRGSHAVCALSRVSILITDSGIPASAREMLQSAGLSLIVTEVEETDLTVVA